VRGTDEISQLAVLTTGKELDRCSSLLQRPRWRSSVRVASRIFSMSALELRECAALLPAAKRTKPSLTLPTRSHEFVWNSARPVETWMDATRPRLPYRETFT
jgi:hypothetical protein